MKSWIAWMKTRRTLLVPAGDPLSGSHACECDDDCLLTESGEDILIEGAAYHCIREE